VTRWYGGVGGEHVAHHGGLPGLLEGAPGPFHRAADAFEAEEGGVPLVHVEGVGAERHLVEEGDSADAEHDLLTDSHVLVAAVQLVRDILIGNAVLRQIGV